MPSLYHTTAFHFYLFFILLFVTSVWLLFSPGHFISFSYNIMCLFIWISFCLIIFITHQCAMFSAFFPLLACLHFVVIFPFHHDFSSSTMTFKGFTFHFYICILLYISPFILHLVGFGSYWICSSLQHSRFCWYNSYTPPFSLEFACISSCLSFCPSLCKYFHTPPQICFSHLIIGFHALSLTMILSSWSLRGSYFAFVYTYLMLEKKLTSSYSLLVSSLFLVATCVCKTK